MTNKMKVFQAEITDGIAEAIKSQAAIAYYTEVCISASPSIETLEKSEAFKQKIVAENKGQLDLFYLESVLVSTGWNKNDDVFLPSQTWAARGTPEDKQFNYMHDENDIIGHITGSYVLDKNGNRIDATQEEAPDEFDIITQAVLYNSWSDPDNKQRMEQIIAEIPQGKWFVSMECLFAGFDYALISPNGEAKLLERNEASAFLSKHLRSYGGTGKYEDYKIGRALKHIAFSGKGLVSKPANPRSVILNSKSMATFDVDENDINTTLSIGEVTMPDPVVDTKQVELLTAELAAAREELKTTKAKIEEAKDKEIASKIKAFEDTVTEKNTTIATLEETIKSTQARVAELTDALAASQKELADVTTVVAKMKKDEQTACRKASLASLGLSEEVVTETMASLVDLPDAAFEAVVAAFKKATPKKDGEDDKKAAEAAAKAAAEAKAKADAAAGNVTPETLEGVESADATLIVADTDDAQKARAEISEWLTQNTLHKPKAKK